MKLRLSHSLNRIYSFVVGLVVGNSFLNFSVL